ncbi:hypothetical protein AAL_07111 [Moelleriella libera RCEF 2490]|uniref:Uncharacterized protein n=1 Tax=Moelleriella libera RCEF 2490 TaxID=1081109 RepID=A0A167XSQ7_9HYPO|nr:hypothetical protein AAL_07111 [Moelleriella libera RCEF 2490]
MVAGNRPRGRHVHQPPVWQAWLCVTGPCAAGDAKGEQFAQELWLDDGVPRAPGVRKICPALQAPAPVHSAAAAGGRGGFVGGVSGVGEGASC